MFTEIAPLTQRIERMIREFPVIDPRTRLNCAQPAATDLADLLDEPGVRADLISSGMDPAGLDPALAGEERVRRMLPYFPRMRNTATSWCLGRILRDLYDFDLRTLDASNLPGLWDKVKASAQASSWAHDLLAVRSGIGTVATSLANAGSSEGPGDVKFFLDVEDLLAGDLSEVLGDLSAEASAIRRNFRDWLDRTATGRVRFASIALSAGQRLGEPDDATLRAGLLSASRKAELSGPGRAALADFLALSLLEWSHERKKAVQVIVGDDAPSLRDCADAFGRFANARISLTVSADAHLQDAVALARRLPNVYLVGDLGLNFAPGQIARATRLRLEAAPLVKIAGYLSDARTAEWAYGKLLVAKAGIGRTLVDLVEDRSCDEDELPIILRQILHATPRDLYDLA